ncbi:MAG: hypothetical protein Q7S73_02905 [bacterium]|nr:hypothetical protein [bacterium]
MAKREVAVDFSALKEMLKEMEKRVAEENANPKKRKTRIFIAPVIKEKQRKEDGR